ncbi:uncharacterized protein TEOVI_000234200 [Trypanosoma equiperdum]|uniref:tRNA pseudouridine(55) synthase n=3 Tax=Trypanozoon TaxID=39700 RepID=D0A7I9_TRYB9|nr:hypothetical protein, conserved [Trypanosoma brucei gambiense DAL972]RHW67202.1 hypothetical protein DPX39_000037500 [Trypanosoma brucei equiperdum]CBH17640.1 hypothetical protein, conserved [Trypanosoma brucei gambiense DAL972]SCU70768.1 hypothetical protein, conserved [Trypanosoma equiperdum]|eukprot:XP_011779904.1 hypothetical protein, conserved [Trypanosoma brucei gambiense DAL972]
MTQKNVLCHSCALRMSIMHQVPPPQPPVQTRSDHCGNGRLLDETYHPRFSIVYETAESALRYFRKAEDNGESTTAADERNSLCCACLGLYQFLDAVHAPVVAATIRTSRFIDSSRLSVNVSVHRSVSFLWLAVAAIFHGVSGRENEKPNPTALVPEEHANFKDFYMSDLRARVLQYLVREHSELSKVKTLVGYKAYMQEITRRAGSDGGVTEPQVQQAFVYSPDNEGLVADIAAEHHQLKNLTNGTAVPLQYCSNRSEGVLTYSVIYDYVFPYLNATGCWTGDAADVGRSGNFLICEPATLACSLQHSNIMLIGNYRKTRRDLSQSPWFVNGKRVGSYSLQEAIADPVLPFFFPEGVTSLPWEGPMKDAACQSVKRPRREVLEADQQHPGVEKLNPHRTASERVFGYGRYKFHSAGREDVDVRMLGSGRPFVLEVISPSRERASPEDLASLEAVVNTSEEGSVEISELRITDAGILLRMAHHSQSKVKRYRCVVWCSRSIPEPEKDRHFQATNAVCDLVVEQRTPVRVLHRRSLQSRNRVIHHIQLVPLNAHWFLMDLETQAGTYVKEFVHGDMGRTVPHLGQLLNGRTDIIQLDVLGMTADGL